MDTEVFRNSIGNKSWSSSSMPRLMMEEDTTKDVATPLMDVRARISPGIRRESIAQVYGTPAQQQQRRDSALEDKRGRRKSWHPKFERKRRKGVVVSNVSPPGIVPEQRQKRPSWWNIFVPDHWPR